MVAYLKIKTKKLEFGDNLVIKLFLGILSLIDKKLVRRVFLCE